MGRSVWASTLAAILALAGAGPAMASLQQTYSISSAGPSSDSMNFDQFNPSSGTLTGVTITISGATISGTVGGAFSGGSSGGGTVIFGGSGIAIDVPDTATAILDPITVSGASCGWGAPGSSGCSTGMVTPTDTGFSPNPDTVTDPLVLAAFTGTGSEALEADFQGGIEAEGPDGTLTGDGVVFSGTVTVSYDYTPATDTPEPASIGLFCAGTLAIAAIRRRRR